MATAPFKVTKRNGIWVPASYGFSESANNSRQRNQRLNFDRDSTALMPSLDRRTLMSIGRWLFQNCSPVRGALNEIAELSAKSVIPQFYGDDKEWGKAAENWLYENDRFLDIRGHPYSTDAFNRLLVLTTLRDGDHFTLLTEDLFGVPKIQVIPPHRVGGRFDSVVTAEGEFKGRRIHDGVIVDDYGRAIGFRVMGDTPEDDRDYSSNDMIPCFDPLFTDQTRGFSSLGASIIDWQDVAETRRFELMAQKKLASIAIVEKNETGEAPLANLAGGGEPMGEESTTEVPIVAEELWGGEARYFRAGSGSSLEALTGDRPTQNQREFAADVIRQALHGIGWSGDFSLDPTKAGGAQMRIVIDGKINTRLDYLRKNYISPVRRRIDAWRIAKAIKLGFLKPNDQWYMWEYQFAGELTADKKYTSDVDIQEARSGFITLSSICAKRGEYFEDVMEGRKNELVIIANKAKELATATGLEVSECMKLLRDPNTTSSFTESSSESTTDTAKQP